MNLALYPSRVRSNDVLGVIGTVQPDVLRIRVVTKHTLHITEEPIGDPLLFRLSEHTQKPAPFRESKRLPGTFTIVAVCTCHEQAKLRILNLNEAPKIFRNTPLHTPPERRELHCQPLRKRATKYSWVSLFVLAGFDGETGRLNLNLASRLHDA